MTAKSSEERMRPLERALHMVRLLSESGAGKTLEELATELKVCTRTVRRMCTAIGAIYSIDEMDADGERRLRIKNTLVQELANLTAPELAALKAEVEARKRENAPHARALATLYEKVLLATCKKFRAKIDTDLDLLGRFQRTQFAAGPNSGDTDAQIEIIRNAILQGQCLEIDYRGTNDPAPRRRIVEPWGLLLGPTTYLCGMARQSDGKLRNFRVDRISQIKIINHIFNPPEDWDFDAWLDESFGVYHGDKQDILLRVRPAGVEKARQWRFHPTQKLEERDGELVVHFRASGLREIAEHLFTWGDEIVIEAPAELQQVMRERIECANRQFARP